jgi:uncharacterized protein YwqG
VNRASAVALIEASALAPRARLLLPHLQPGARARAKRDPSISRAIASRFGGVPVVPRGATWPSWNSAAYHEWWIAHSRKRIAERPAARLFQEKMIAWHEEAIRANPTPLQFLGLVCLRELGLAAELLGLPHEGALIFFYDVRTSPALFVPGTLDGWRVMYAPEDDLVLAAAPRAAEPEDSPSRLSFEVEYSFPADLRLETGEQDFHVHSHRAYAEVHDALVGPAREPRHQIGGSPKYIQDDPRSNCVDATETIEGDAHARARELTKRASGWRLLFQIDTDEEGPGWMWGDAGCLFYCIRGTDLADRRFDRTLCDQQSH